MTLKENHLSENVAKFYERFFTIPLLDEIYGQIERRLAGGNVTIFDDLYIIPDDMMTSINESGNYWTTKF